MKGFFAPTQGDSDLLTMDLEKNLVLLGLNPKEARIYVACLQLGTATVAAIAQATELKRATCYLIFDGLENQGLVSKIKKAHTTCYTAEDPGRIVAALETKKSIAQKILPSLQAIYNVDPIKPLIKIAEGIESVRNIYINLFNYLAAHPKEELLIYGSLQDALVHFEGQALDYFYRSVGASQNLIREIGNDDHATRKYFRSATRLNPHHDMRLIRKEGRFTETDNMIYGNTLVIFSVKEEIFAITIESASIAETYRTVFNLAWRSAKPM